MIKLVSRIRVITHPRGRSGLLGKPSSAARLPDTLLTNPQKHRIVAVGASTGGPGAIVTLLRTLPEKFQIPIVCVLHIGEPFAVALADWLDSQSTRRVALARDGDLVSMAKGKMVMAPSDRHLEIRDGRFRLTDDPERHSCRPSVDVLFESVAMEYRSTAIGCLLTGMGRDGASGLLAMRVAGGKTIAQDEDSSVVYGMPREAALLGAAQYVLPIGAIAQALTELSLSRTDTHL